MPLPWLYILHPQERYLPGITKWLTEVDARVKADPSWDGCVIKPLEYDDQAGFYVPTVVGLVKRRPGPVILIQKVRRSLRERLEAILRRSARVLCVPVSNTDDLWMVFQEARQSYEDGEPRISRREVVAYLIVRKLAALHKWGGKSSNKAFLWSEDLPKGSFPKDIATDREIIDIANMLAREGVLVTKQSQGKPKYGLADKSVVQPILDTRSFASCRRLKKFFEKDPIRVSSRRLDFK